MQHLGTCAAGLLVALSALSACAFRVHSDVAFDGTPHEMCGGVGKSGAEDYCKEACEADSAPFTAVKSFVQRGLGHAGNFYSSEEARRAVKSKTIIFVGDSTTRQLYHGFCNLLLERPWLDTKGEHLKCESRLARGFTVEFMSAPFIKDLEKTLPEIRQARGNSTIIVPGTFHYDTALWEKALQHQGHVTKRVESFMHDFAALVSQPGLCNAKNCLLMTPTLLDMAADTDSQEKVTTQPQRNRRANQALIKHALDIVAGESPYAKNVAAAMQVVDGTTWMAMDNGDPKRHECMGEERFHHGIHIATPFAHLLRAQTAVATITHM